MTRVVEPMIDPHQALHNTNMIEMRRCHFGRAAWEKGPTRLRDSTVRVDHALLALRPAPPRPSIAKQAYIYGFPMVDGCR
jgi:hypothetical protein